MPPIEELIPHRAPMVMVSALEEYDDTSGSGCARVDVMSSTPFYDEALGGVPAWTAIEIMAQTIAAVAGMQARVRKESPQPGFLIGSHHMTLGTDVFRRDESYWIRVAPLFEDGVAAAFDCRIYDASQHEVADATVNVVRASA